MGERLTVVLEDGVNELLVSLGINRSVDSAIIPLPTQFLRLGDATPVHFLYARERTQQTHAKLSARLSATRGIAR